MTVLPIHVWMPNHLLVQQGCQCCAEPCLQLRHKHSQHHVAAPMHRPVQSAPLANEHDVHVQQAHSRIMHTGSHPHATRPRAKDGRLAPRTPKAALLSTGLGSPYLRSAEKLQLTFPTGLPVPSELC